MKGNSSSVGTATIPPVVQIIFSRCNTLWGFGKCSMINSAWSSSGKEDERHLWMAAETQFNDCAKTVCNADIRLALMHHPADWLNDADQVLINRRTTERRSAVCSVPELELELELELEALGGSMRGRTSTSPAPSFIILSSSRMRLKSENVEGFWGVGEMT